MLQISVQAEKNLTDSFRRSPGCSCESFWAAIRTCVFPQKFMDAEKKHGWASASLDSHHRTQMVQVYRLFGFVTIVGKERLKKPNQKSDLHIHQRHGEGEMGGDRDISSSLRRNGSSVEVEALSVQDTPRHHRPRQSAAVASCN